jgi:UDP-N-acetylglucosamine 2-epimerase (non-hydrolysing)/UDP-GlcNAc3NAcA epimerase
LRVLTVIGNRPQFVKAAAVSARLREVASEVMVHTGQHYDDDMSRVFFDELGLPRPEHRLELGGGSNTTQTARMLGAVGDLLRAEAPDAVLVYGDTNSTLAGAVAGAQARVPVAHVEAGMRSYDRAMPEELNRVLTDHASDLLLCPSEAPAENLHAEGVRGRVEVVGDVMVDIAQLVQVAPAEGDYVAVTAHRAGTVDDPHRLRLLVDLLLAVPHEVRFPVHPRTRTRLQEFGLLDRLAGGAVLLPPLGYVEFTALVRGARAVLTDSGGVQKEAYLARVPCVTLRDTTEWTETVAAGWNTLVDLDAAAALAALEREPPTEHPALYGDGRAGERVVAALLGLRA